MFEKAKPIVREISGLELDGDMIVGALDVVPAQRGGALRAVEWNDLRAKLEAARDLRRVLRRDSRFTIEVGAASFGDAAASYFNALEQGQRTVNPDALEQGKASNAIGCKPQCETPSEAQTEAATGETRDD